jgi:hypothetical protein
MNLISFDVKKIDLEIKKKKIKKDTFKQFHKIN